jgi:hypothetical protein
VAKGITPKRDPKFNSAFRLLGNNYEIVGEASATYNCIAHAAGDKTEWWQNQPHANNPRGAYWPPVQQDGTVESLEAAFKWIGYRDCKNNSRVQWGYQKVALYATASGQWTHAARLRCDGRWSSKCGDGEIIAHDSLDGVSGIHAYGSAVRIMRRCWIRGCLRWLRVKIFGIRNQFRWPL